MEGAGLHVPLFPLHRPLLDRAGCRKPILAEPSGVPIYRMSITLAFIFLGGPMGRVLAPYIAPIPIVLIGLLVGLFIAGSLVFARPLYFVTEDYYTLLLGIFFGTVGFAIFGVRGRLMEARAEQ